MDISKFERRDNVYHPERAYIYEYMDKEKQLLYRASTMDFGKSFFINIYEPNIRGLYMSSVLDTTVNSLDEAIIKFKEY